MIVQTSPSACVFFFSCKNNFDISNISHEIFTLTGLKKLVYLIIHICLKNHVQMWISDKVIQASEERLYLYIA